jgi:MAF protein
MELILASNSPRRRYLLALLGMAFRVVPADVDEQVRPGEAPVDYVLRLAEAKARAVGGQCERPSLVLSADTTVVYDGEIIGKPAGPAEAEAMLRQLRGRIHQVYTAIALLNTEEGILRTDLGTTAVPMRWYSDVEMEAYIASGDPLDKAGAYAIQHDGFHPVGDLSGCYANVVGLPLCHLTRSLRKLGTGPETDVPQDCQAALSYDCPIYEKVLREEL